jgi:hypothetical protein
LSSCLALELPHLTTKVRKARPIGRALLLMAISTGLLFASDLNLYREFRLGMSVSSAVKKAGMITSDVEVIRERPQKIQQLEWRPSPFDTTSAGIDPVRKGVLSFYNGELFRIVISYDQYKIDGMTAEDLVESISSTYGLASRPKAMVESRSTYPELTSVLARWENAESSIDLVRTSDQSTFPIIICSKHLSELAEASISKAVLLDAQEAPQRAIDLQRKQDEDARITREKARSLNKPNFRP